MAHEQTPGEAKTPGEAIGELLHLITEHCGCTLQESAAYLATEMRELGYPNCLVEVMEHLSTFTDEDILDALVKRIAEWN